MWHWSGPGRQGVPRTHHLEYYMASGALHDRPFAQEFYLHYVYRTRNLAVRIITVTVIISTNVKDGPASESIEPPVLRQKSTPLQRYESGSFGLSCRKGLHFNIVPRRDRLEILATPLDNLILEGGRGTLWMRVQCKELRDCTLSTKMDMDEATGRVVIWGWDKKEGKTKVFVGDLV